MHLIEFRGDGEQLMKISYLGTAAKGTPVLAVSSGSNLPLLAIYSGAHGDLIRDAEDFCHIAMAADEIVTFKHHL